GFERVVEPPKPAGGRIAAHAGVHDLDFGIPTSRELLADEGRIGLLAQQAKAGRQTVAEKGDLDRVAARVCPTAPARGRGGRRRAGSPATRNRAATRSRAALRRSTGGEACRESENGQPAERRHWGLAVSSAICASSAAIAASSILRCAGTCADS